jgi:DNA uptake protein ComE-like DNA-binding protein
VVLVVIVLLSLAAYTFSEVMISEYHAVDMYGRDVQSRLLADSGVEMAAALLGNREESTPALVYHNPAAFSAMLVVDSADERSRGRFSIVAPLEADATAAQVRYGLIDESAKLNLNAVLSFEVDEDQSRDTLLPIPGMTEEIADCILDFVDEDDEPRVYGAESEFYQGLQPPYYPKNGPLETLDELLLVAGVTPQLLYGEDANRNGLLDLNENDEDASLPLDNGDGVLDLGWFAYLTVFSRESNLRADGTPKIDLNQALLTELYDELEEELGAEAAQFIVAYRMYGASNLEEEEEEAATNPGVGRGGQGSTGDAMADEQLQKAAQGVAKALVSGGEGGAITRGGMDLSQGATTEITSIYYLIDAEVTGEIDGKEQTLKSPWTSDASSLKENLPLLFEALGTTTEPYLDGRININQARAEVLAGIPEMTEEILQRIISGALVDDSGQLDEGLSEDRATTGWLLIEGLVDLPTLRKLDPYLTARGDVYRAQILGHFDVGGPVSRIEAVIDATAIPPKVISRRDMSGLGPAFPLAAPAP